MLERHSILIIPAEGDSVKTEGWYQRAVESRYDSRYVHVLDCQRDLALIDESISFFFERRCRSHESFEIHAQGGFGAFVALKVLESSYSESVHRVFLIGGAPCEAMTPIARLFHLYISRLWYMSKIPFFADDPNPNNDPRIELIKKSSTMAMREDPKYYRDQLICIGTWSIGKDWRVPQGTKVYFIPNGDTVRPKWWDNTYNNDRAAEIWRRHGVMPLAKPGSNFSFYSLMPTEALFRVMDTARDLEKIYEEQVLWA